MDTTPTSPPNTPETTIPTAAPLLQPAPTPPVRTTAPPEGGYEAGFPKIYYSVWERLPPRVVKTLAEEEILDRRFWMTIPPQEPKAEEEPVYPKIFTNINVPARIIHNPAEEIQLGSDWIVLDLESEGLVLAPAPTPPAEPPAEPPV